MSRQAIRRGADMTMDREFYERRMADERAAASVATDAVVRARHEELADLYAERLKATSARDQSRSRPTLKVDFNNSAQQS